MLRERTFALITFRKTGWLRFLSHLDVMRAFDRAIRRAKLPVAYSQGFSPHAQLSIAAPLPVGVAGENEWAGLQLKVEWDPRALHKALARQLPPELGIVSVETMPPAKRSVFADLAAADYMAELDVPPQKLKEALKVLEKKQQWIVHRVTKSKELDVDLRPRVIALRQEDNKLFMRLGLRVDNLAKPEEVLALLEEIMGQPLESSLTRLRLYTEKQLPFAAPL